MTTNSRNTFALVACVLTLAALVFVGAIAMRGQATEIKDYSVTATGSDMMIKIPPPSEATACVFFYGHASYAWLTLEPTPHGTPGGMLIGGSSGVYLPEHCRLRLTVEPHVKKVDGEWIITFGAEAKKSP